MHFRSYSPSLKAQDLKGVRSEVLDLILPFEVDYVTILDLVIIDLLL